MKKLLLVTMLASIFCFDFGYTVLNQSKVNQKMEGENKYDEELTMRFLEILHSPDLFKNQELHKELGNLIYDPAVDVNRKDANGDSPLLLICRYVSVGDGLSQMLAEGAMTALIKYRKDLDANAQDSKGNTILHELYEGKYTSFLLRDTLRYSNTNLLIKNNDGKYAWELDTRNDIECCLPDETIFDYYVNIMMNGIEYESTDENTICRNGAKMLYKAYNCNCRSICHEILYRFGLTEGAPCILDRAYTFAHEAIELMDKGGCLDKLGAAFVFGDGDPARFDQFIVGTLKKIYDTLEISDRVDLGSPKWLYALLGFGNHLVFNPFEIAAERGSVPWMNWCLKNNIKANPDTLPYLIQRGNLDALETVLDNHRDDDRLFVSTKRYVPDSVPHAAEIRELIGNFEARWYLLSNVKAGRLIKEVLLNGYLNVKDLEEAKALAEKFFNKTTGATKAKYNDVIQKIEIERKRQMS